MFGLIAYIFKIIISLGSGYIIGYSNNDTDKHNFQLFTSLTSFVIASVVGVLYLLVDSNDPILIGIVFLAVLQSMFKMMTDYTLLEKYKILFSAICGLTIGLGFIFYSIAITLMFSYIANNYDIISDLLGKDNSSANTTSEIDKNALELNDEDV